MKPLDKVRSVSGRVGLVRSVDGWPLVEVLFTDGATETVHADDLTPVAEEAAEELLGGRFGEAVPYGLRLQALFLQHAYRFDPGFGLSNARVEPNLHQVFVAHRVTNKLKPRMILADEVGLGKTIEAGLILKELRARQMVERVLVICPASLQYQWQAELRSKFNEEFEIVNSAAAKYLGQGGANPFVRRDNVICSLPFAVMPRRSEQILDADWDLVIFDEAHRVRRWRQSETKSKTTQAYRLAEELKEMVPGLLMLTATPMQLHPYELYSLIELAEPGLYPTFSDYDRRRKDLPRLNDLMRQLQSWRTLDAGEQLRVVDQHGDLLSELAGAPPALERFSEDGFLDQVMDALVERHPQTGVMVRNRKAVLGNFAPREARRHLVAISAAEHALYDDVAAYLRGGYNRAQASKQIAIGLVMVTYHKMLASSSNAIYQSLKRRRSKLAAQLSGEPAKARRGASVSLELLEEVELSQALTEMEEGTLEREALVAEIAELDALIARLAEAVDSKADALLDVLEPVFTADPDEKVVIFTQFLETQSYLQAQLIAQGYRTAVFNGSLKADDKELAIRRFRHDAQILISTEAGGEGRNLQFAHLLVNYDLPWNPMKVEQRIGRLDRIGQKRPVFVYNLACQGTLEERVLDVLEHRIQLFTESVGSLDPILGEVEHDIEALVMSDIKRFDEQFSSFADDLDRRTREARETERTLADFVMDRASLRHDQAYRLMGNEALASHKDLAEFTEAALDYYGGVLKPHVEGGSVVTLSPKLQTRVQARTAQWRGVFDPQEALTLEDLDFFAMGHELIDRIVDIPTSVEPATTAARILLPGHDGRPAIEIYYQIRTDGPVSFGRVIRHLVTEDGVVVSKEVLTAPPLGAAAAAALVPPWAKQAVEASRIQLSHEYEEARVDVRRREDDRRIEEVARAERIYRYRRDRLRGRIDEASAWIDARVDSGSVSELKILPARRGKLEKDRGRLERLAAEHEAELARIEADRSPVSVLMWAAGVVTSP